MKKVSYCTITFPTLRKWTSVEKQDHMIRLHPWMTPINPHPYHTSELPEKRYRLRTFLVHKHFLYQQKDSKKNSVICQCSVLLYVVDQWLLGTLKWKWKILWLFENLTFASIFFCLSHYSELFLALLLFMSQ